MSGNDVATRRAEPVLRVTPGSEGTKIEVGRAFAQVQGAMAMAKQFPRDTAAALRRVLSACAQPALAQRAFFRYNRGGSMITGPSVHLARTLAQSWGNIDFGLVELARDDAKGVSEMLAWATDLETNARSSTTFQVPHVRVAGGETKQITDPRDVYELLANNGARRLREQIFAVIPGWLVEEAKAACMKTLENGGGEALEVRVTKAVNVFAERFGIAQERLERALGGDGEPKAAGKWDNLDVARLQTIYTSLSNGETTVEEEFPPVRLTAADVPQYPENAADDSPLRRARRTAPKRVQETAQDDPDGAGYDPTTERGFGQEPQE